MKFKISNIHIISEFWGDAEDDFSIQLYCDVSVEKIAGVETFIVNVVSPKRLARFIELDTGVFISKGYIFTQDFDKNKIKQHIQGMIDRAKPSNWQEINHVVGNYFDWV